MKFLKKKWKSRTLTLVFASTAISILIWTLEFTQWADDINRAALYSNEIDREERREPPAALIMILPFVKVLVLMAVPASIVIGLRALYRKLFRKS